MNIFKINKYIGSTALGEISQSITLRMTLLRKEKNKSYTQVHAPVKCRDFFVDCFWSKFLKTEFLIYGFKYNFKENPYSVRKLYMSVFFPSQEIQDIFMSNLDKFPNIEGYTGIEVSLSDIPNTIIISADKVWLTGAWKISLFSYILKTMCYKSKQLYLYPEQNYSKVLTDEVLNKLYDNLHKNKQMTATSSTERNFLHNYSGVVSLVQANNNITQNLKGYIFEDKEVI